MVVQDEDEEEAIAGFGLQSLFRTSLFVTLWWALWSLYDFYLSPYSPWPEFLILVAAAAYSLREDAKLGRNSTPTPDSSFSSATPWPCTSDGCMAEDDPRAVSPEATDAAPRTAAAAEAINL
jgi:cytoskeletal protein RodZ